MADNKKFYKVITDLYHARLPNHLEHGYETERDFRHALYKLSDYWKGRVGECVDERNGFCLLRYHDTPGGRPDEAWLPAYLLQEVPRPSYMDADHGEEPDDDKLELERIHGFD